MLQSARHWARRIKQDVIALWIAARDRETPLVARVIAAMVAAYAISPIDLIPDFIPILGYVDDVILVPLGMLLAIRLIPPALMARCREAAAALPFRPVSYLAMAVFIAIWVAAGAMFVRFLWTSHPPGGA